MSRSKKGGRNAETTKGVAENDDEPSNCIICLERVSCRGKLSVCNHWFCFPCILEWAENTNTCPICKTRFRCITKVHVSPFKSPPTKVRVGDKDQRVWNDDDDLVAEDVLDAIDSDDLDDDYEPSVHVDNPWTRSLQTRGRQQGHNVQRGLFQTSRQLQLDQYDLEDSFIDDTDQALQAYLYSAYSRDDVDNAVIEEDDESDTGETDDDILPCRVSPYILRNTRVTHSRSSGSDVNSVDRALQDIDEQSCTSPASTNSFIISDDESADELNSDWIPFGNHSKNSRNNNRNQVKTRKQGCKQITRSQRSGPSSTKSQQSQRLQKQQETEPRQSKSRRKREVRN